MPRITYKNKAGKRVPSVTTILQGWGFGKEGLMAWANWVGREQGISHRDVAQAAATAGTIVHMYCEAQIRGTTPPRISTMDINRDVESAVWKGAEAWHRWRSRVGLKLVASEASLVSEEHQYGGTMDLVATEGGEGDLVVLDIKTSKRVYDTHPIQLVAYGKLWEEFRGDAPDAYSIIRLDRRTGALHHHEWSAEMLEPAWEAFLLLRRLYDLRSAVQGLV